MEHKAPGVGSPAGLDSSSGTGSSEQPNAAPRRRRARSGKGTEKQQVELTVAGVAWRPSGAAHALVVLARGEGAGQMRSSLATLNVFHAGQAFPVTAPVTVIADEHEASARQTLRFVFRLPASAPTWRIERMVLRWRGTEVELPPPAQPPEAGPAPHGFGAAELVISSEPSEASASPIEEPAAAAGPAEPVSARYGPDIAETENTLTLLHEDIVTAKLELAHLQAEIAQARLDYEEASMATEYAQKERDRAQQWVRDVTAELEDVEQQLAECRYELDRVNREIAARREALEQEPRVEPPSAMAAPPEEPSVPAAEARPAADPYAQPQRDLNAALSQLRSRLDEVLSQAPPTEERDQELVPEPVGPPPRVQEVPAQESVVEELFQRARAGRVEEPPDAEPAFVVEEEATVGRGEAAAERAAPPMPASLPGASEREDGESSWFARALRRMAQDDREQAGRVLVSILPAQSIATPRSFHYDLVVRDDAVYAVDAHPLDTRVQRLEVPRSMDETDAWIMGSLEQLGDVVAQGKSSFRRLFNRNGVKVKGQRARVEDLLALATAPLRLRDLCAVGAPIQPHLLLQMIVSSADQSWMDDRPLSIRFNPREEGMHVCSFRMQAGSPMVLGAESTAAADFGDLTTIAEGSARSLMRLLADLPSPEDDQANVRGPVEPLELLQSWVKRLELSSL